MNTLCAAVKKASSLSLRPASGPPAPGVPPRTPGSIDFGPPGLPENGEPKFSALAFCAIALSGSATSRQTKNTIIATKPSRPNQKCCIFAIPPVGRRFRIRPRIDDQPEILLPYYVTERQTSVWICQ